MTLPSTHWLAALATVAILLTYEIVLLLTQQRHPQNIARSAHASLREEWFEAMSRQPGSEILAVQTLRNALMSATMTASTAALGLIGAVTLTAPSVGTSTELTVHLALELTLVTMLFASLVCSATAVRYYNHAGFIIAMPVGSPERARWAPTATLYLRRAGLLYSWGLRHLLMVAPILVAVVYPLAGPVAALLVVVVLAAFDRFPS
jgi:hypothetical protein